ncbi:hypothetical protein EMIHUDRAFT_223995 [Emiliania huxleyi CCMP1516]|uniref:Uncharacterized protein n=2 Tax=Emiliania huxleyi TaxID=2903 RepID=A0A0D3KSZ9_EMIH1|nr:hypothetical protein EMIHUDRAFT_223995 [Emiliania huxleyi CCMP1516]EOD38884.1 hypothetical protein EMIHUDRAFT_223995 [Emiliania huxleyi CCMP1516]|eukprot:XP_005791313.1 hypothetical protein EMIHUDRAFT_223995 [Emiliania huxleyi CCMP1516]
MEGERKSKGERGQGTGRWHTRGGRVVGGDRRIPSYGGDYRYAREDKGVEVQLLLFESFGGFGKGVREILRRAADVLQNKLTRAQYLDEVTWTTKSWLGLQKQRISVVLHTAIAEQVVNELACGGGGRVHGAKEFRCKILKKSELSASPPSQESLRRLPCCNAPTQPADALPSAPDLGVSETKLEPPSPPAVELDGKLELWRKRGGGDLEPVLASSAVAVLDAQWVISHAEAGGVLTHRQALPKEAFLSFADLVEATGEYGYLPVAALSYPWLTKDHPDPRGANLARVARALKALLSDHPVFGKPVNPRLGVFWDFGSLHQHPDPPNGVLRTEEQNALFKQGLSCLGTLYSHPKTYVLRLTSFPDGHKAEDQAEGTNVAKYFDRGWCSTENAWASLTKAGQLSLDLGKMRAGVEYGYGSLIDDCVQDGGRRPPLLPSAFAAELEKKSFTNGKDDKPLVKQLYEAAFKEQFGKATVLNYRGLGWGDAEAAQLAEVLASGAAPRLERLELQRNKIGDEGCKALAAALGKEGAAPRLETLSLGENKIGDEGCKALAAALGKEGAAPRLKELYLFCNEIGDEGCKALAAALKEGAAPSLKARDAPLATRPSPAQCSSHLPSRAVSLRGQQGAA